ncbi:CUB domain-containing protein [Fulvivirga ligni]|uniref:CUB domain-containing protein n=1 Tax=Fulvivirga ligni TaxID=2904246 RepID=UPI001F2265E7|nr:CUB domain-containing protein [Fulvivirga ligni]UII19764.1 M4 family metallopeptidase [Fulvivirga ligni]
MRTILWLAMMLVVGGYVYAQKQTQIIDNFKNRIPHKSRSSNSAVTTLQSQAVDVPLTRGKFQKFANVSKMSASDIQAYMQLTSTVTLKSKRKQTDHLGITHESFQTYYKGVPVLGYDITTHAKKDLLLQGATPKVGELDVSPALSKEAAKGIAQTHLKVSKIIREYPVDLKLMELSKGNFILVYEVRVDALEPLTMKKVFIDAKTGEVTNTLELIAHNDTPATANTYYSGNQNITVDETDGIFRLRESGRKIETYNGTYSTIGDTEFEDYSDYQNTSSTWGEALHLRSLTITPVSDWWANGADAAGDFAIQILNANDAVVYVGNTISDDNNPTFFPDLVLDNGPYTVEIYDFDGGDDYQFGGSYTISASAGEGNFSDTDNSGTFIIESDLNPALDVHWGMELTYDFYKEVFDRDSYDGNGSTIKQFINPPLLQSQNGRSPNNAFAFPPPYNVMCYGLGDGSFMGPVVGLDVEGHEFTHMVIEANGNGGLDYQSESGALNESFADIFGVCVEFFSGHDPDWVMGEDIMINEPFLRSMTNPKAGWQPDTYHGDLWADTDNIFIDNGGVHTNSGVQNHWFYLLSEGGIGTNDNNEDYDVPGIGIEKARDIAYRNLMEYLPSDATYYDAYLGSLQAVEDLYGNPSNEYTAVKDAWLAVGVGNTPNLPCGGTTTLTERTGTITDGSGDASYSNNLNCRWLIMPEGAEQIVIDFTEFNTESNFDRIEIYEGPNAVSEAFTFAWSGGSLPGTVVVNGGAALIKFTTDESIVGDGWSLDYSTVGTPTCSGVSLLTEPTGTISDGSGADSYGNNQVCFSLIAPSCATSVTLSFTEFDLEEENDKVIIFDGYKEDAQQLAEFSGSDIPDNVTSNTGIMLVIFDSDYAVTEGGFTASYTSEGSSFCSGTTELTNDHGTITDGSGASDYCNSQNCSWLIAPENAESVTINFLEFDLEPASTDGTIYDAVRVYDGPSANSDLLGTFAGDNLPPSITSSGGSLFITFNSDLEVSADGWSLEYTSTYPEYCSGTQTLTAKAGELSDGSGNADYGNNSICSWLIAPANGLNPTLSFTEFNLENEDVLRVYNGENTSANLLVELTGSSLPGDITSTTGALFLEFLTDDKGIESGWSASYLTTPVTGIDEVFFTNLEVFPNPVEDVLNIKCGMVQELSVSITDLLGHEYLQNYSLKKGDNKIDVSQFSRGIYLLHFQTDEETHLYKIVVE